MPRRPAPPPRPADPAESADPATLLTRVRRLLAETQALSSRIAAINEIAVAINSTPTLAGILPVVADQAKWILDFDYCGLGQMLPGEDRFKVVSLFGTSPLPPDQAHPARIGLIGQVVQSRQPLLIADLAAAISSPTGRQIVDAGYRSGLFLPLATAGQVLGVLILLSRADSHYTVDDLRIAHLLALQLAGGLNNVRAFEQEQRRARQFEVLALVGRETTGLQEVTQTLQRLVHVVRETFGYLRVNLAIIEGDTLVFGQLASFNPAEEGSIGHLALQPTPQGITGWVAHHNRALVVRDVQHDPRYVPHPTTGDVDPVRAECALPIRSRDQVIGVLDCQSDQAGAFDRDEQHLLETVASQISAALEAQSLYSQVNDLFQKYVSARLARAMLARETSSELGGARQEVTVLFADLDNFSTFAERTPPEELIESLQVYLGLATDAVLDHGGTLTQYLGDGLMAVFNAPQPDVAHPWQAVQAALAIQANVARHHQQPGQVTLHFAIGLHTGDALVGNLGTAALRCYTAVGDTVNLAKRVQELGDAGEILITGDLYGRLAARIPAESLGPVRVKGRATPVEVYRLHHAQGALPPGPPLGPPVNRS